jgi:hypothetical protein
MGGRCHNEIVIYQYLAEHIEQFKSLVWTATTKAILAKGGKADLWRKHY